MSAFARFVHSQPLAPVVIADAPSCAACRITFQVKAVIADDGVLQEPTGVERDSQGRIWVAQGQEMLRVYGPTGRFVQEIGRKGQGPNEWLMPFGVVRIPGDSMLVIDGMNERLVVVDAQFRSARTVRFPGWSSAIVPLKWPLAVVHGVPNASQRQGAILHITSFTNSTAIVSKSFGFDIGTPFPQGDPTSRLQRIGASQDGGVWTADAQQYRFALWDAGGNLLHGFIRKPDWFARVSPPGIGTPTTAPSPQLLSIHESRDGLLWIVALLPRKDWKQGWIGIDKNARDVRANQVQIDKMFRSAIEVVDPKTGRVVVRQFTDDYISRVTSDGDVVIYRVSSDGTPSIVVKSMAISRTKGL